jgi:hypothetical protein
MRLGYRRRLDGATVDGRSVEMGRDLREEGDPG